jgi:uncharacterized protein
MVTKRARVWLSRGGVIAATAVVAALGTVTWVYSAEIERTLLRWPDASSPERLVLDGDPSAVGLPFTEVLVGGPLGDYPAWLVEGTGDVWVVMVHGIDADRREALRALPAVATAGNPALVISYRNDGDGPADGTGRHMLGRAEWPDLRAAVQFARREGARHVVLYGFGAGGSVVAYFMAEGRIDGLISGVVLDAPLLDATGVVASLAAEDKLPGFLVTWSRAMVTFRFGLDWSTLDHVGRAELFDVPVLIFHGEDDTVYPVGASVAFAEAAEDATLIEVPGAGHGEAWNVDPDRYERELRAFLARVSAEPEE